MFLKILIFKIVGFIELDFYLPDYHIGIEINGP